ncbi:MAG: UDP-N-acetylmuramoyl-tripeptide--D-alanyl-D-alanine ligase, partial [Clostridiales bacterium]|nr:UDP-N-acetylmuramoyl-tripeptide--D-alanyl-D-alanine ligase [Clostridiales bacterium]
KGGAAIVNGDDELLLRLSPAMEKITFGTGGHCDYRAENISTESTAGVTFDILNEKLKIHAEIPAFGSHLAPAALAAAAVGVRLGLSGSEIAAGLKNYKPVGSRSGVIDTGFITIIDDCYNANPHSMSAGLRSLASLKGRRAALLGDMKDLGAKSNELHREIGLLAGELGIECLICCGEKAEFIFNGYIASRFDGESHHFPLKDILLERLPGLIRKGDTVLVKASHSMGFEDFVAELEKLGKR